MIRHSAAVVLLTMAAVPALATADPGTIVWKGGGTTASGGGRTIAAVPRPGDGLHVRIWDGRRWNPDRRVLREGTVGTLAAAGSTGTLAVASLTPGAAELRVLRADAWGPRISVATPDPIGAALAVSPAGTVVFADRLPGGGIRVTRLRRGAAARTEQVAPPPGSVFGGTPRLETSADGRMLLTRTLSEGREIRTELFDVPENRLITRATAEPSVPGEVAASASSRRRSAIAFVQSRPEGIALTGLQRAGGPFVDAGVLATGAFTGGPGVSHLWNPGVSVPAGTGTSLDVTWLDGRYESASKGAEWRASSTLFATTVVAGAPAPTPERLAQRVGEQETVTYGKRTAVIWREATGAVRRVRLAVGRPGRGWRIITLSRQSSSAYPAGPVTLDVDGDELVASWPDRGRLRVARLGRTELRR